MLLSFHNSPEYITVCIPCIHCATLQFMARILVVSDIHANKEALDAVIADVGDWDAIWCLGDMIGYGPDPVPCLRWVRDHCDIVLAGNHDVAAYDANQLARFNPNALTAATWTNAQLAPDDLDYLRTLPSLHGYEGVTLAHGSPADPPEGPIWSYILTVIDAVEAFAAFAGALCFVGHSHVACAYIESDAGKHRIIGAPDGTLHVTEARYIVNPGSVGQPRDRDADAAYLLYDPETQHIMWRRVAYDREVTQEKMRALDFPARLITRLDRGT